MEGADGIGVIVASTLPKSLRDAVVVVEGTLAAPTVSIVVVGEAVVGLLFFLSIRLHSACHFTKNTLYTVAYNVWSDFSVDRATNWTIR
ncbi:hypothetical protein [Salinicola halophilus]|uniref:hypothetical protein n=1 Tax=Salinicola halophilus TaxID=184065 RepID=UPI0013A645CF|nr:hypothetical protein [Salinicola halophilus]